MKTYVITDRNRKKHSFSYPDIVWEQGPNGPVSRPLEPEDHAVRITACKGLVKDAISGRLLKEEKNDERIH